MTLATKYPRRMALPLAAIAALLLAGCSSGNVGESWQCPLADAGTCDSVAAADPAVPHADAAGNVVLGEPLWRVRASDRYEAAPERPCEADCGGFDPFDWLARLFGVEEDDSGKADGAPQPLATKPSTAASPATASPVNPLPGEPAPALLPAEPGPVQDEPDAGDLRTDEVVARIWIAPFVDADGVYREASWVRAVLKPAGWRLGR